MRLPERRAEILVLREDHVAVERVEHFEGTVDAVPADREDLAEAEIEYETKLSPSVYLRFTANAEQRDAICPEYQSRTEWEGT